MKGEREVREKGKDRDTDRKGRKASGAVIAALRLPFLSLRSNNCSDS